jgi:hypothetical protein
MVAVDVLVSGRTAAIARVGTAVSGTHAPSKPTQHNHKNQNRMPFTPFSIKRSYHPFLNRPMLASPSPSVKIKKIF